MIALTIRSSFTLLAVGIVASIVQSDGADRIADGLATWGGMVLLAIALVWLWWIKRSHES